MGKQYHFDYSLLLNADLLILILCWDKIIVWLKILQYISKNQPPPSTLLISSSDLPAWSATDTSVSDIASFDCSYIISGGTSIPSLSPSSFMCSYDYSLLPPLD